MHTEYSVESPFNIGMLGSNSSYSYSYLGFEGYDSSKNLRIYPSGTVSATTFSGSLSGNASTATTLATARNINGTSFNGSAAITTAIWGTSRNIGIVNSDGTGTAVTTSVNGSANINLKLPSTIKASLTGNATTATTATTANHLPTAYVGGVKPNPQTYFNNTVGLKVAMTGVAGSWSDTL